MKELKGLSSVALVALCFITLGSIDISEATATNRQFVRQTTVVRGGFQPARRLAAAGRALVAPRQRVVVREQIVQPVRHHQRIVVQEIVQRQPLVVHHQAAIRQRVVVRQPVYAQPIIVAQPVLQQQRVYAQPVIIQQPVIQQQQAAPIQKQTAPAPVQKQTGSVGCHQFFVAGY